MKSWHPPRALLLSWLALLALLGLTVFARLSAARRASIPALALAIALGKALIVAAIFMELRDGMR